MEKRESRKRIKMRDIKTLRFLALLLVNLLRGYHVNPSTFLLPHRARIIDIIKHSKTLPGRGRIICHHSHHLVDRGVGEEEYPSRRRPSLFSCALVIIITNRDPDPSRRLGCSSHRDDASLFEDAISSSSSSSRILGLDSLLQPIVTRVALSYRMCFMVKSKGSLNLAHLRTAGGAAGDTTTHAEAGEDGGDGKGGEAEPEEGGDGLALTALLHAVGSGAGDLVGQKVRQVRAAVDTELGGKGNGSAEPEDGVQDVQGEGESRVDLEGVLDRGGDEVEEGEHGPDGAEHGVVDDAGGAVGAGPRVVDHVTGECHDEQGPEELKRTRDEVDQSLAFHCDGVDRSVVVMGFR